MNKMDFSWIYLLIFIIIPLSRIIPRLIAKRRMQNAGFQREQESFRPSFVSPNTSQKESPKPQSKSMLVLGEICKGTKTFENIQKNTGFDSKELNTILEDLEKNGMLKVQQKQGLFGPKVELYPTEKGSRESFP